MDWWFGTVSMDLPRAHQGLTELVEFCEEMVGDVVRVLAGEGAGATRNGIFWCNIQVDSSHISPASSIIYLLSTITFRNQAECMAGTQPNKPVQVSLN